MLYIIVSGAQETFEALSHFLFGGTMKEYKTNIELINYLISKGLIINDKENSLKNLERYSYYSIINGYKFVFKNNDNNYKENTSFEEIFALYEFDKNIKSIFLKYILEIEIIIKSLMSNTLAKQYGIQNYLNSSNFDDNINKNSINIFIKKIEKEIDDNYIKHPAIKHYKDVYGFVPPFVLTKILTFGTISKYYSLLKQYDRQTISKYFKLSDKLLKQILINLTMVRNISAHSDRLFAYRNKYDISFKNIEKKYNEFRYLLYKEIEKLKENLTVIDIKDILIIM